MDEVYQSAKNIAQNLIDPTAEVTKETIENAVTQACNLVLANRKGAAIDKEQLCRELERLYNLWLGKGHVLDSNEPGEHIEWLTTANSRMDSDRPPIEWRFWERYKRYQTEYRGRSPRIVSDLGALTTEIVRRLEDPLRPGSWDRRGMVVGSVQSGKTANFIGIICKAIDVGYRVIIVLAGMHNNLRSQTQSRIDEEVLGLDTDAQSKKPDTWKRIGVGKMPGADDLHVLSLTTSNERGDFTKSAANQVAAHLGSVPLVLVVKKNGSVLKNLNAWLRSLAPVDGAKIPDVPLLMIDDECDNASINTKKIEKDDFGRPLGDEQDVTVINRQIRRLMEAFEKRAYVGYTATPFASVFIYPHSPAKGLGDDLFPRSFIVNLPQPSNYRGPAEVFGLDADPDVDIAGREGEPTVMPVRDYEDAIPDGHKPDLVVKRIPASLRQALLSFILSCAARRQRGQADVHNSMLVHVTRYTAVQHQLKRLVSEELEQITRRLRFGEGDSPHTVKDELRALWETEFVPKTKAMNPNAAGVSWKEIEPIVAQSATRITVKEINGSAADALEYRREKALSVVAIGGDKLSRGLTLEGLSVSYYLRASQMYDTLMQMGRWFGYRDGYEDLCRIYTTDELIRNYRWVAAADLELRREFDRMAVAGETPETFGLRVRRHPEGLMITSLNKMREGEPIELSFEGDVSQTVTLDSRPEILTRNNDALLSLMRELGPPHEITSRHHDRKRFSQYWPKVDGDRILRFLRAYTTHSDATKARAVDLHNYVKLQLESGDLRQWAVALVADSTRKVPMKIGEFAVFPVKRRPANPETWQKDRKIVLSVIATPTDESVDLTEEEFNRALEKTRKIEAVTKGASADPPKTPSGSCARYERPPSRGLLLIYPMRDLPVQPANGCPSGFAISFPGNPDAKPLSYTVNATYIERQEDLD